MNKPNYDRLRFVIWLLNGGVRAIDIAKHLGISRERVRQLIRDEIPWWELHIPCRLCGKSMETKRGLRHLYHKDCTVVVRQEDKVEQQRTKYYHQRNNPDGEFEEVALTAYAERNYDVLWMPAQAPFDFVVKGVMVDVKGAHLDQKGNWQFAMPVMHRCSYKASKPYPYSWDIVDRCDIAHCIGEWNGNYIHYLIPSALIGDVKGITINPERLDYSKWAIHQDGWVVFEQKSA